MVDDGGRVFSDKVLKAADDAMNREYERIDSLIREAIALQDFYYIDAIRLVSYTWPLSKVNPTTVASLWPWPPREETNGS